MTNKTLEKFYENGPLITLVAAGLMLYGIAQCGEHKPPSESNPYNQLMHPVAKP